MKVIYKNKNTKRLCEDEKYATKVLGKEVAIRLSHLMNIIEDFINLYDVYLLPQYRLHKLKGNRNREYSFVIHKQYKWRLIIYPCDIDGNILDSGDNEKEMLIKSVQVEVLEVSKHYD